MAKVSISARLQSVLLEMRFQWSWYPRAHLTAAVGLEVPMVEQKRRLHP